jgi:anaerobic magnesium-protoporphyrin IX monomethyl ester cyclase
VVGQILEDSLRVAFGKRTFSGPMLVVGGLIVGNPSDTRESIEANLEFARRYVDWPYIQHPTPYPGTPMANDFRGQGLIENEQIEEHDGTTAVVRTLHLSSDEVEFLRWKAERWMKVRHIPAVLRHDPRSSSRMHVACWPTHFAGVSIRSLLGLENKREAFARYKALRRAERELL